MENIRKREEKNVRGFVKIQKGITLIALVVTIIILIILAGVSISMVVGDNGIITQAREAERETANATIASEKQMNALVDEMNQYLTGKNETEISIDELEAGDYIEYDSGTNGKIMCRVLYPADSEYGLQIITNNSVEEIALSMETGSFEEAKQLYNSIIENLNNKAETYINSEYATDARCVGSIPTIEEGTFIDKDKVTETTVTLPPTLPEGQSSSTWWTNYKRPDGWENDDTGCYGSDTNYTIDQTQMQSAGILATGESYWLASHGVDSNSANVNFRVRYIGISGGLFSSYLCAVDNDGTTRVNPDESKYGFRPCILLSTDIKVTGGDGENESTAYKIE